MTEKSLLWRLRKVAHPNPPWRQILPSARCKTVRWSWSIGSRKARLAIWWKPGGSLRIRRWSNPPTTLRGHRRSQGDRRRLGRGRYSSRPHARDRASDPLRRLRADPLSRRSLRPRRHSSRDRYAQEHGKPFSFLLNAVNPGSPGWDRLIVGRINPQEARSGDGQDDPRARGLHRHAERTDGPDPNTAIHARRRPQLLRSMRCGPRSSAL